ncbi:unnamed protein product [Medioppia subpectinata]|uniref:MYND-type domain-containing protein n=1 Tax=Medioppia subpectinata TaxID=1979941 RepID=A0A7R9Q2C2_9ACAR|nr:unnamed protein product [Medioppia subpectinata]CAG2109328.1 unnamed protein product [Medioppia subpectinata]
MSTITQFKPFVCALKANQKTFRCDQCFISVEKSIECHKCQKYWYCSQSCLRDHWIVHQFECDSKHGLLDVITNKCNAPAVREESDWIKFRDLDELVTQTLLLLRILFRLKSDPKCATNELSAADGSLVSYDLIVDQKCQQMHKVWDEEELEANDPDVKVELIDEMTYNFGAWLSVVREVLDLSCIKDRIGSVEEHVLMKAFRIVVRNTLYVCDTTFLNEIGKAIYVEMCFIRHSCVPNCCPLFDGNNVLNLRQLDSNLTKCDLRYDFQIEMTGFPAQELFESLLIRDIKCDCIKCLTNSKQSLVNLHKNVTNANLKYGNWPTLDYCHAMSEPIDEALENFVKMYGKYHPWITALLLWKFKIEWKLYNCEDDHEITGQRLFASYQTLKDAVNI